MSEFWFARRFPVGHPRNSMTPVTREGWRVVYGFLAAMVLGAFAFAGLAVLGVVTMSTIPLVIGIVVFVVCAAVGGGSFVWLAVKRGDTQRTVEDYRRMKNGTT